MKKYSSKYKSSWFVVILLAVFFTCSLKVIGQEVIYQDLPFLTVDEIGGLNDSLVDEEVFPLWRSTENKLVQNCILKLDTSWWNKNISTLVDDWKKKNDIKDDESTANYNLLFKDTCNNYHIKKLKGKVHYLFSEIGGGYKVTRCVLPIGEAIDKLVKETPERRNCNRNGFNPELLYRPIIGLFDETVKLDEKQVSMTVIEPHRSIKFPRSNYSYDTLMPRNVSFKFRFDHDFYQLNYCASLAINGYNFKGIGTIQPVFFNVSLKLINLGTNEEQIIYKNPNSINSNLSEIKVGNIDDDNMPDILLSISNEASGISLVYLSNSRTSEPLLKYIGYTEVYCIDP